MKYLVSIYVWGVGGLTFGLILIIGLLFTFLLPAHVYDPYVKKMLRLFFRIIHTKVEVSGLEKIDPNRTYLFMANHVSIFDVLLLGGYIPNFVRGVEADKQHGWPLYGWAVKRYGNISIARDNVHKSIQSIKKAARYIREGKSVAILPEGHRTLDGKLRPFKKLPFYLAKESGVDLVPIGMSGLYQLKRKGNWLIRPTKLKLNFGEPISKTTMNKLTTIELRDLTHSRILELIESP